MQSPFVSYALRLPRLRLEVSDEVKDGCWTNAGAVKTAVELELKRSGYKLATDEDLFPYTFYTQAIGFEKAGICVASYSLQLWGSNADRLHRDGHNVTGLSDKMIWNFGGVYTGGKNIISGGLKDTFVEGIQKFLIDIDRKREEVLNKIRKTAKGDAKAFWANYKLQ